MHSAALAVLVSALLLVPSSALTAQAAGAPTPVSATPDLSQEPVVLRDTKIVLQYNADGTGVRTESQAFTVQSEGALRNFGVIGVAYASATQKAEFVYARVRRPDGTVTETPLDGVQEQAAPVTREAPFYSDLKQLQLPVRGLHLGDTVEWQTRITIQHPESPNQFWDRIALVRGLVTLNETIELRVPAQSTVKVWTNPTNHVQPQQAQEGGERVYRWQWKSLDPTVGKQAEAATKAREGKLLTADEEMDELQGRLPDIAFSTFPSWAAVGAWYQKLEADRTTPDGTVRAKVAEITAHATTEEDKVRAVYDWVASNIRYIGVAFGIGRFQPHTAAAVLDNQYGDCKDKHTLLASMLLALGEQPDAVLIGAGVRLNDAVPAPDSFNHLITHVSVGGKPVWLDTTAEVAPYQVLLPQIRDKQALVVPAAGVATLQRTPAGYPFPATASFAVQSMLDKDLNSDSEMTYTFHDDTAILLREVMRQATPAKYPDMVQAMMSGMGFAGTTSDPSVQNLSDLEKPLVVSFHYHRTHDSNWGVNRVTVPFVSTELRAVDAEKPPVSSIQLGAPRVLTSTVDLKLPEGWKAELPEAVHQQIPQAKLDVTYRLEGRTVHAERKVTVLSDKVPAADWKQYKKWYDEASAGDVPYLQLVPPGSVKSPDALLEDPSAPKPAVAEKTPVPQTEQARRAEAARLVGKADQEMRDRQLDAAEADLNAAKELNPDQANLWGEFGAVARQRGNNTEALKQYLKEVQLHPESTFAWRNIIYLQGRDNRKAAQATAREWIAASPALLEPRSILIGLLLLDEQNEAALTAAKAATAELPQETREGNDVLFLLGETQLRAGQPEAGGQTLARVLANNPTQLMRNNTAYELAKARQQLPLAEATERALLKDMAAQTLTWTGDESPATMQATSSLLAASWDTMGWVLYQQGKYADAEPYIRAAWRNGQHAEVGEHLGDVLLALHRDTEAQTVYYEAMNVPGSPASSALQKKLHAASVDSRGVLKPSTLGQARIDSLKQQMQAERTWPAGAAAGRSGTTEYRILFTRSGVVKASPTHDKAAVLPSLTMHEAKFDALFPAGEQAALLRLFFLNCAGATCSLVLEP